MASSCSPLPGGACLEIEIRELRVQIIRDLIEYVETIENENLMGPYLFSINICYGSGFIWIASAMKAAVLFLGSVFYILEITITRQTSIFVICV